MHPPALIILFPDSVVSETTNELECTSKKSLKSFVDNQITFTAFYHISAFGLMS